MYQQPQLVQDGAERYKLKVSLPGGRYQLSLDDRAVNVLMNDLNLKTRDTVPKAFVPFFVAMGDAWFPRERDTDSILEDLRAGNSLTADERDSLIEYVTESLIAEPKESQVRDVIARSPVADAIDPADLNINSLPEIPSWSGLAESDDELNKKAQPTGDAQPPTATDEGQSSDSEIIDKLQEIPGIGPKRAKSFVEGGITSLSEIAESRPIELSTISGITEGIGAVAVEGARELLGEKMPASDRLANQTDVEPVVFEPTLRSLAASGVPATEAADVLRVLYGPTVVDVDGVTGLQAYYLWEAGYQTPNDLTEASIDELTEVYQIGDATAPEIRENARKLLDINMD